MYVIAQSYYRERLKLKIMKTIWKYKLDNIGGVEMPKGAEVLCVQVQDNEPCLWALVDPNAAKEIRHFLVVGTGHVIEKQYIKYVSTFQMHSGILVFHVFEVL